MELKIDNELATSIFRDAFLKAIPEAERERIFVKAIGDLLSEGRDRSYGRSMAVRRDGARRPRLAG